MIMELSKLDYLCIVSIFQKERFIADIFESSDGMTKSEYIKLLNNNIESFQSSLNLQDMNHFSELISENLNQIWN
jgi:hypothetical protein